MNPKTAHAFMQVIESLTDPAILRATVERAYPAEWSDTIEEDTQILLGEFTEIRDRAKAGLEETRPQTSMKFLDEPPTMVFLEACREKGLSLSALDDRCRSQDDGRIWLDAGGLGADAQKYTPEIQKRWGRG